MGVWSWLVDDVLNSMWEDLKDFTEIATGIVPETEEQRKERKEKGLPPPDPLEAYIENVDPITGLPKKAGFLERYIFNPIRAMFGLMATIINGHIWRYFGMAPYFALTALLSLPIYLFIPEFALPFINAIGINTVNLGIFLTAGVLYWILLEVFYIYNASELPLPTKKI